MRLRGPRVWTHFGGHPYSWIRRNLVEDSVLMVDLSGTAFTEFSDLRQLKGLMDLNLDGTGIEDLSPLADLTRLQNLSLSNTRVSDLTAISALPDSTRLTSLEHRSEILLPERQAFCGAQPGEDGCSGSVTTFGNGAIEAGFVRHAAGRHDFDAKNP